MHDIIDAHAVLQAEQAFIEVRWPQGVPIAHAGKASQPLNGDTAAQLVSTAKGLFRVQLAGPTWRLAGARSALHVAAAAIETVQQLPAQVCASVASRASTCLRHDV